MAATTAAAAEGASAVGEMAVLCALCVCVCVFRVWGLGLQQLCNYVYKAYDGKDSCNSNFQLR